MQELLEACRNARDRLILVLLWDTDIGVTEAQVKDFQKSADGLYAVLNISDGSKNYSQRWMVLTCVYMQWAMETAYQLFKLALIRKIQEEEYEKNRITPEKFIEAKIIAKMLR